MKLPKGLSCVATGALLLLGMPQEVRAGGLLDFWRTREPDVLTVTDITDEGKNWPQPAPGKPIYYEAMSFGTKNFPGIPGDPSPNARAMLKLIVEALSKQGYRIATEKGQATIFLSISWGYNRANLGSLAFLGGDKLDLMWETRSDEITSSNVLRRNFRSRDAEMVMDAANSDLYIASIRAYDLKSLDAGTEKILWHTRIACPASGLNMASALPTMIKLATPYIGVETKKPMWRGAEELKSEHIEIGPAQSVEYLEQPKSPAQEGKAGPDPKR